MFWLLLNFFIILSLFSTHKNMDRKPQYSLSPVQGILTDRQILHLLRRTLFGVGQKDLLHFRGKSAAECMSILLTPPPERPLPIQEEGDYIDPLVPIGDVWVNAPYEDDLIQGRREVMLCMWWVGNIVSRSYSLLEKMTLFWRNHFVTEVVMVKDARYSYQYIEMLRRHALGNFKELIKEGSTNPAMLVYLSGNYNTKEAPNENYARELFELFTIGKEGGQKYTEQDVREASRVLTGYIDDKDKIKTVFRPERHDSHDKAFSAFFNERIIKGRAGQAGQDELSELVDMIFDVKETAAFCCRNLYRWFVSHQINSEVEEKIISPLADVMIKNEFEIKPVLETLLCSEHFFDSTFYGCVVKSPVEYFIGAFFQFDEIEYSRYDIEHNSWLEFHEALGQLGMDVGNPPSVAGWPAFYQAPKFHRWWANSASLSLRKRKIYMLSSAEGMVFNGANNNTNARFQYRKFIEQIPFRTVDEIIETALLLLIATEVAPEEKDDLKDLLLAGGSEAEWKAHWQDYLHNKEDKGTVEFTESRLRPFFKRIVAMAEYHMM